MKRTDYAAIAPRYDDNEVRRRIPTDDFLASRLGAAPEGRPFTVLDLACGTGNYLSVQTAAFRDGRIEWHGLDASESMLSVARGKVSGVDLRIGRAEALPYESGSFDYVVTSFAFHHFEDKPRALDEIRRVTREGGAFRMRNIAPGLMPRWWVYTLFPEAVHEDEKRFWSPGLLYHELAQRGYEPDIRVNYHLHRAPWSEIHADVVRRDISELTLVTPRAYEAGAARLREAMERDPAGGLPSELALLDCTAPLRG